MKSHYVFLIKEGSITPQSLDDGYCGDVLRETLRQGFHISRIHVHATSSKEALENFLIIMKPYQEELTVRTMIC